MKNIYILGGGTFFDVRCHNSLAVRAFGETAIKLETIFNRQLKEQGLDSQYQTKLVLTRMAQPHNNPHNIITNADASNFIDTIVADPQTKVIVQNFALCDFEGTIDSVAPGKHAKRLRTSEGEVSMRMSVAPKLIKKIRQERKDIFAIGFKTTDGVDEDTQYLRGLDLLKTNSLNLVLANDVIHYNNMIVAPEETRYNVTKNRDEALENLVKMTLSRMQNHFTRSTVVQGDSIDWNSSLVPENLRTVVNYCIKNGAYKPFLGKTAGHFAVKVNEEEILTSIRKTNFNNLDKVGLVKVVSKNKDEVIAHGYRPSVGGQSQRIIFSEHPEECIVHFHCPVKPQAVDIPVKDQWPNECGSHECGANTSKGLKKFDLQNGQSLKVVYLDNHGPNIVFTKETDPQAVIDFIENNFSLDQKTGGMVHG